MTLPVAILSGGLATRLKPLTDRVPKALLDIAGKPFAVRQIELLQQHGFEEIVFCLGHLGEEVQNTLGDGSRWSVKLSYSFDGEHPLGTGGALRRALPLLGDSFAVIYGDSYLECDYREIIHAFQASGKHGLMTVFRNAGRWDRSNVVFQDGCIKVYDKTSTWPEMRHIDYGLGIFRACAFEAYSPDEPMDLATVYQDLLRKDQLAGFEVFQRFYEIGSPPGLAEIRSRFLRKQKLTRLMTYTEHHLSEAAQIIARLDIAAIEKVASLLADLRDRGGRLFFLGVGGSAANCSHAVNDFRKIAGIEAYAPTDNVAELTARTNDEGWDSVFVEWLKVSRLRDRDMLFVFSVGGGNVEKNISLNLVEALKYARQIGTRIVGVVGRDGGYTAQVADACVIIPTVNSSTITPHAEAFQAVVWHLLVSHPALKLMQTKWEGTK